MIDLFGHHPQAPGRRVAFFGGPQPGGGNHARIDYAANVGGNPVRTPMRPQGPTLAGFQTNQNRVGGGI